MKFSSKLAALAVTCSLVLGLTGCSGSDDASNDTTDEGASGGSSGMGDERPAEKIEMFSWWTEVGPAEALQALVDLYVSKHPGDRIINAAEPDNLMAGEDARKVLEQRFEDDNPPDLFQTNAFAMKAFLAARPGKVQVLDDLFEAEGLTKAVAPEVLRDVTIDGHIYAVPVNIHRENTLFFNKHVFKAAGLQPPTTMQEFLDACETLKAAGVTPVAMSTSANWILLKLFMALAVGSMGPEAFIDNFNGNKPFDEAELTAVIEVFDKVLTDYIDVEQAASTDYGWQQAATSLFNGEAGMFIHGDWAKGYFVQLGWTPNVDFGVVSSPGAQTSFLYGMDVFGVPTGSKHPDGAADFVRTAISIEGQITFNTIKGSSPVRLDVPTDDFDSMGQEVADEFKNAEARVAQPAEHAAWNMALGEFAKSHDRAALLAAFVDNPPGE